MEDVTERERQLDWVLLGGDMFFTDDELADQWDYACQRRDWTSAEYIGAEQEYRESYHRDGLSRQDWYRIEMEKLDKKP